VTARMPQSIIDQIERWAASNDASRSEAIRRLVELGLTIKILAKQPAPARASRAKELATKAIEKIIDPAAPPEERAKRRRHLTKGPLEFRDDRVDLPKSKR
jgi:Arc/MetJ-type ribon-helix-helix transcriptional regulator